MKTRENSIWRVPAAADDSRVREGQVTAMNIMIVEDDAALNRGIALAFGNSGDTFYSCYTVREAKDRLCRELPDMVILDVNLGDGSGYEILKEIRRASDIPVLLLTANDLEIDQVTGLSLGADDYVTKPFSLAVLRARIEALKRRCAQKKEEERYRIGELDLDFGKLNFYKRGRELTLSRNEQKLLRLLVSNPGQIMTRELLIDRLWSQGAEFVDENALSVTMNRLRRKLEDDIKDPRYIQTVYGQGYVWISPAIQRRHP